MVKTLKTDNHPAVFQYILLIALIGIGVACFFWTVPDKNTVIFSRIIDAILILLNIGVVKRGKGNKNTE